MSAKNDSFAKTIIVAVGLCLICSVLVSGAAVVLKPQQVANSSLDKKRNILEAAGIDTAGKNIAELFKQVEQKFVDLETGNYVEADPMTFDQRKNAKDPKASKKIEKDTDLAKIGRRSTIASVYLVKENGQLKTLVVPVHGKGLFSTLYGFLALEANAQTVVGLKFYEHGETPGLGGEVENPLWLEKWPGKTAIDANGQPTIKLVKGGAKKDNEVDALSGASMTTRGVQSMLTYWLGNDAFGPYLTKVRKGEA